MRGRRPPPIVPVSADVGNTLTISVTGTNGSGSSTPATSLATSSVIDIIPVFVNYPIISGTAQVGQTLTTTPEFWTHNPTSYAYRWGNTASGGIAGATASTYVPVTSDIGFMLNVSVQAINSGGSDPRRDQRRDRRRRRRGRRSTQHRPSHRREFFADRGLIGERTMTISNNPAASGSAFTLDMGKEFGDWKPGSEGRARRTGQQHFITPMQQSGGSVTSLSSRRDHRSGINSSPARRIRRPMRRAN